MKEYGGYIELDKYNQKMLHSNAIALNCGRNCLAYLIRARNIKKINIPYFICDSILKVCEREKVVVSFYSIDNSFCPLIENLSSDEWVYVVNYYGQISKKVLLSLKHRFNNLIVDNAQAYFVSPNKGIDTIYTSRKFLGVADGAFLYTDAPMLREAIPIDQSFDRYGFILGRFERPASEFYRDYVCNNNRFNDEPIKKMSCLTDNFLHGIDYDSIKMKRTNNYSYYHSLLKSYNQLELKEIEGAFAYPFMVPNGARIRPMLQQLKIYIPMLWPSVIEVARDNSLECELAYNILPLPCDQRISKSDIDYITNVLLNMI